MKNTIGRGMSTKIQFKLDFNQDVEVYLKSRHPELKDFRILSKSLDARGAPRGKKPIYLYHIEFIKDGEEFSSLDEKFNLKKSFLSKKSAMLFINKLNYLEKEKLEDLSMASEKWLEEKLSKIQ